MNSRRMLTYCQFAVAGRVVVRAPQTTGWAGRREDPQHVDPVEVQRALLGVAQDTLQAEGAAQAGVRGRVVHAPACVGARVDAGDVA